MSGLLSRNEMIPKTEVLKYTNHYSIKACGTTPVRSSVVSQSSHVLLKVEIIQILFLSSIL